MGSDFVDAGEEIFLTGDLLGGSDGAGDLLGTGEAVGKLLGIWVGKADCVGYDEGGSSTQGQSSPKETHSRIGDHIGSLFRSLLHEYLGFPEEGP